MSATVSFKEVLNSRCFNGQQKVLQHSSTTLGCDMKFGIYLPDREQNEKLPVLFFLSGLTCSTDNFIQKSGFQRFASAHKIIVVNSDTSPRIRIDGDDTGDYGQNAGFYVDATQPKWSKNYKMFSYIVDELVPLIFNHFSVDSSRCGIFGHSMGGHGALTIGLKKTSIFKSISAFSAICNVSASNFGKKAYAQYFGAKNTVEYLKNDAVELAKVYAGPKRTILLDQGINDGYYEAGELSPEKFVAATNSNLVANLRMHEGYEHSYYFVATFIEDHFKFHTNQWASSSS